MADHFDPYHKWLSIPPEEQPPNHYRLLGTKPFESDLDVIESAADQRMAHLRTFQNSKHGKLSQRLLNEISAARVTLLKPDKKAAYDETLRQELEPPVDDPLGPSLNQLGGGTTLPAPGSFASAAVPDVPAPFVSTKPIIKKKPTWILPVGISVSALVLLGVVIVIILFASNKGEGEGTVAEQKSPQQADQSPHDKTNGGEADGRTVGIDTPKSAVDGSVDGQTKTNGVAGQNDGTTNDGETSNPVKRIDEPPTKTDTTAPETPGTNDTSTQPVEPPKPIVIDTPKKQPLPTDEQQEPVFATLEETFKLSEKRSSEDQLKLAAELLKLASESKDSVEKFVLLRGTMSLADEGGDATLVMRAIDSINQHFQIDRLDIAQKALLGFADSASSEQAFGSLSEASSKFIGEAISEDRIDLANQLAEAVYDKMVKSSAASKYRKQAYDQRNQLNKMFEKWKKVQNALAELKLNPADPDANLVIGKWHCFEEQDWKTGLPHLAKSSDEQLKSLAVREISSPPMTTEDQVALADDWWNAAENATNDAKEGLQLRAGYWYRESLAELKGVTKTKVEKRLDEIAALGRPIAEDSGRQAPLAIAPFDDKQARGHQLAWSKHRRIPVVDTNSIGMKLTLIPAGEFMMGSPSSEEDRGVDEQQHRVRLSEPFYLGMTEVTQGQWQSVMGTSPWFRKKNVKDGAGYPAAYISWQDAVEFCHRLGTKEGVTYRLPTEAEWEYACRAGSRTTYSFGDDASQLGYYAWYEKNAADVNERYAHPVGTKRPNAWGLYDMHGNLWEWCLDWYEEDYYPDSPQTDPSGPASGSNRAFRGGGWNFAPLNCRSASRRGSPPGLRSSSVGFRVARSSASK